MYVQYKVNVSENQVDTLKDSIRVKKGATLCFPKDDIRGDPVLLPTSLQNQPIGQGTSGRETYINSYEC